ncbi:MAG: class I SAM-dependent methyltransferase [Candidatus Micrarchaeia archaeon]
MNKTLKKNSKKKKSAKKTKTKKAAQKKKARKTKKIIHKAKTKTKTSRKPRKKIAITPKVKKAFNTIADDWNKKRKTPSSPTQIFFNYLNKFYKENLYGLKILDAGCGNGRNMWYLLKKARNVCVWGMDTSPKMLLNAQKNLIKNNAGQCAYLKKASITNMPLLSNSFNAVFCLAVLHHLQTKQDRIKAFLEINRVLHAPGIAFIAVWNKKPPKLKKHKGKDALVQWKTSNGKKAERFYHFFTENELTTLAKKTGFKKIEVFHEKNGKKTSKKNAANICMVLLKTR